MGENILQDLSNWGAWAPLIAFMLGVLQAIFPYVPFFILAGTYGLLFGFELGILISFTSILIGAMISFWLSRSFAQEWVLKKFGEKYAKNIEDFSSEHGFKTVLLVRIIPVIPSPLINVLAGVSKIKFSTFSLASAIGKFPFAVLYTLLGHEMARYKDNQMVISVLIILAVLVYIIYRRQKAKKEKSLG